MLPAGTAFTPEPVSPAPISTALASSSVRSGRPAMVTMVRVPSLSVQPLAVMLFLVVLVSAARSLSLSL